MDDEPDLEAIVAQLPEPLVPVVISWVESLDRLTTAALRPGTVQRVYTSMGDLGSADPRGDLLKLQKLAQLLLQQMARRMQ